MFGCGCHSVMNKQCDSLTACTPYKKVQNSCRQSCCLTLAIFENILKIIFFGGINTCGVNKVSVQGT